MMHGPGAGHNKNRPSLHPRDRDRDRGYDEGEIGEIPEPQPRDESASREPWDDRRAERWGRGAERRHSGAFGAEEDGELPLGGGGARPPLPAGRPPPDAAYAAHAASRDILKSVSAAPTPTMEPFAGPGAQPGGGLARHLSAPASADAGGDPESPAPKRKKLGWGQGLARSKSTGVASESRAPEMEQEHRPPSVPIPDDARVDAGTPPFSLAALSANPIPRKTQSLSANPFLSGDDSRSGAPSPSPLGAHAPRATPMDPVARAAAAAASEAEAAARREMLAGAEKAKAEILRAMDETDARIAALEREIAESEDRERSDREQMDEQRQHQEARLRRELEGVSSGVERAEKASSRAAQAARQAEARAEELRRKAGLIDAEEKEKELKEKGGKKQKQKSHRDKDSAAARASARAVQRMLAGREPRVALVSQIVSKNARLAETSHVGLKNVCGLPLPHELPRVSVETIAATNATRERCDPDRLAARAAVTKVLRARREATREKALSLAVTYLKRRERWRLRMQHEDLRSFEKEMGVRPGGKLPALGTRGSSRHAGAGFGGARGSFGGAARSEYEELQMIQELQARERLKTLVKLPAQILDPEDARFGAFTANRNALVEDPKAELELLKHTRPWAEWEKKIFHEKFASYGKNFKRVATFIDGRTTAECVTYYYQRQKTDDGFKSRRRAQAKKRRAYAEAKRMTGGAWNGPGGPSAGGMSAAALAKASREREAELRAAEEERKGRSAEARQERAALAAAEKKKAKEKAAREKRKREKEKETEKEKREQEKETEKAPEKQEASESAEAGDAEAGDAAPAASDPSAAAAQTPAAAQPPGVAAAPNVSGPVAGGGEAAPAAGTKRKAAAAAEAPTKGKGKGKKAAKTELPDASLQWGVGVEEKK
jgi:nuclear receptor co-repressor 1